MYRELKYVERRLSTCTRGGRVWARICASDRWLTGPNRLSVFCGSISSASSSSVDVVCSVPNAVLSSWMFCKMADQCVEPTYLDSVDPYWRCPSFAMLEFVASLSGGDGLPLFDGASEVLTICMTSCSRCRSLSWAFPRPLVALLMDSDLDKAGAVLPYVQMAGSPRLTQVSHG